MVLKRNFGYKTFPGRRLWEWAEPPGDGG
jgi:hypothetical protein